MKEFISYEGFDISYDENLIRAEKNDHSGFVEFSMNDVDQLIRGEQVQLWEIDKLYDLLKNNHKILQAALKGEWVEMEDATD